MAFWCAAQLDSGHVAYALHCLERLGYETYAPRLRTVRVFHGRKIERLALLFPSYAFVAIAVHWHEARRAPAVVRLVMAGDAPAQVPDAVIAELRAREQNGAIELVKPPARFQCGDEVRIIRGPFERRAAIFAGMGGHARVAVLLDILGGTQRADLAADAIQPMSAQAALQGDGDHYGHRHRGRRRPGRKHRLAHRAAGDLSVPLITVESE
jgi:transcriptional antiterminator RfaH